MKNQSDFKPTDFASPQTQDRIDCFFNRANHFTRSKQLAGKGEHILILGPTGSGKSTVLNYLMGVKLISRRDRKGEVYIDTADKTFTKIGHEYHSETFKAIRIEDKVNNWIFWDCCGFNDTNGA